MSHLNKNRFIKTYMGNNSSCSRVVKLPDHIPITEMYS